MKSAILWRSVTSSYRGVNLFVEQRVLPQLLRGGLFPVAKLSTVAVSTKSNAIGPAARFLIELYGLSLDQLSGTGPKGILLKEDALSYVTKNKMKPIPQIADLPLLLEIKSHVQADTVTRSVYAILFKEDYIDMPFTGHVQNQKIPIAYSTTQLNLKQNQGNASKELLLTACRNALKNIPDMHGKMLIRMVERKGLQDYTISTTDNILGSINTQVSPDERTDSEYILQQFTARDFSEQHAVLSVGSPNANFDTEGKVFERITATLSFNNAVIDDASACKFLQVLKKIIENNDLILLGESIPVSDEAENALFESVVDSYRNNYVVN